MCLSDIRRKEIRWGKKSIVWSYLWSLESPSYRFWLLESSSTHCFKIYFRNCCKEIELPSIFIWFINLAIDIHCDCFNAVKNITWETHRRESNDLRLWVIEFFFFWVIEFRFVCWRVVDWCSGVWILINLMHFLNYKQTLMIY